MARQELNEQLIDGAKYGLLPEVKLALRNGANVNFISNDHLERTALHYGAERGHTNMVIFLLDSKAKTDQKDKDGETPLHIASDSGHTEVVKVLLAAGAGKDVVANSGNTPLYNASYKGHTEIVKVLLEAGASKDIPDNDGKTPLEIARDYGHHEIVKLLQPKTVEATVTNDRLIMEWNIDNFDEVQVFVKPDCSIKLVVPPFSVADNKSIDTTVEIVKSDDVTLPPNVEPVSCFYKIGTSGSFTNPIQLHLQHNVDLTSCDNKRLAFVTSSGSPPYQFEFCDVNDQIFDSNRSGVVRISHFSDHVFAIIWKVVDSLGEYLYPIKSYAMTPFYKQISDHCWQLKVIITQNLAPYFETLYSGWTKRDSGMFYFDPDVNTVSLTESNLYFYITSLKAPQVDKKEVDDCPYDSDAFPLIHIQAKLKPSCSLCPLKVEFKGMTKDEFIVLTEPELTCIVAASEITLSDELLAKVPKKKHLISQLNPIKHQWKAIGVQLDVEDGSLKSIEYNPTYNNTDRLSEVFQIWSDGMTTEVSWRTILDVIKNPPIDNKRLEIEIRQFLSHSDVQNIYLSTNNEFYYRDTDLKTFPENEPLGKVPPVAPKPNNDKSLLVQIKVAAQKLHQETKQWEDKSNDMIGATKRMAGLMIKMSEFKGDGGDDAREDFVQTAQLIVRESEQIVKLANKVCAAANDYMGLKRMLLQVVEAIPTISHQLKILAGVTARQNHDDLEADKASVEMLIVNAKNLMSKVSEVLHATETVMIYNLPPETRGTFTGLDWTKNIKISYQ